MINVGLIGAGRIGAVHAKAITAHPKSCLVAISDFFAEKAEELAIQYNAKSCSSEDILADDSIDAVLIASSTDTHIDLIDAAVKAGKAVLCEKPLDLNLQRAQACYNKHAAYAKPIMLAFNRRFDPNFIALKKAASDGEIGKTEMLALTSFDPAPPPIEYIKVSGGLYRDMMIHDFDMANFMMGVLPDTIIATGSSIVDPAIGAAGDVDTAVAILTYADGKMAVIKNSRRAVYGYDQRIELLGSNGLLQATNVLENTVVKSTIDGVFSAKPTYFFLERYMSAYEAEWGAFVTSVIYGSEPPTTLADGVAALAMAEAAKQSLNNQTPIKLADIL